MPPVSTWCRAADESPESFVTRVRAAGADGLALTRHVPGPWLAELLDADAFGLRIVAVEAPCPAPRSPRRPRLGVADRDERRAAEALVAQAIDLAAGAGAPVVVITLGQVELTVDFAAFARRLGQDRRTRAMARDELAAKVRLAPAALDHARQSLDALLERANDRGAVLAVQNRPRFYDLPDPTDLAVLLADFAGAPLRTWLDPAAAYVRELFGWGDVATTFAAFGPALVGLWRSDASGLTVGLPWGRGEVDRAAAAAALPAPALAVVHAAPGITDDELRAALSAG
jgi:sugar phosphate isomerase/epimerase